MMDNIWYDSEVYNGRGTRTEYGDGNSITMDLREQERVSM